tara:strand:+ start:260 stop:1591 length:1332 start_codon:yes stop_codon:yes gene_type:complete
MVINNNIHSTLIDLLNLATSRKIKVFVVGGTIRDHLLNKNFSDIDLTAKNGADLGIQFAQSLNFTYVQLDKTPGRATTRIILPNNKHFDLNDLQGTRIEEDLEKRDFTINAMGQELSEFLSNQKHIIDPLFGKNDLQNSLIKVTSPEVFQADPLRMLRAFRFAAAMNFSIDEKTLTEIYKNNKNITTVSGERVWQELITFLEMETTGKPIKWMRNSGLLNLLLSTSFLSNREELLSSYNRLEHILSNPRLYFPEQPIEFKSKEKALIKFSLLLKKAETNLDIENRREKDFGTPKSFGILKTLKASNTEIAFICKSIQCSNIFSKSFPSNLNDSFLYDLCSMSGGELVAGVLLKFSTLPFIENYKCMDNKSFDFFSNLLKFYFEQYCPAIKEKPLLNGEEIIKKFNISPSPVIGNVLNLIRRAQVLREIKTKIEAEMLAEKFLE